MDVLYRLGEASVAEVEAQMPGAPSYDAVRLILVALSEKGHLNHRREGRRYVYWPKTPATEASRSALRQVTKTYFKGSPKRAVLALLDESGEGLSAGELEEIAAWIEKAREEEGRE